VEIWVVNLEVFQAVELQAEYWDGSIFRDKREDGTGHFLIEDF
jgi:hypothetical protein